MPEDPWPRVKELFQAALDQKPEARAAFLAAACGDDAFLRGEVESLLASHEEASGFLEDSALPGTGPQWEGRLVGAYRILGAIGPLIEPAQLIVS